MTTQIKLSATDLTKLNSIKKDLLTNSQASASSNTRSQEQLKELADKYSTDTQTMWDLATFKTAAG